MWGGGGEVKECRALCTSTEDSSLDLQSCVRSKGSVAVSKLHTMIAL